jgi:EAL domain-containing protein (putative c-di-GMP-specific phosphodiesterase class I)
LCYGIADDRIKFHFVRAMQDLAEICNALLVAEGIERSEDFNCIRDMGIACGQGYFIARPELASLPRQLAVVRLTALDQPAARALTHVGRSEQGKLPTARSLLKPIPSVAQDASNT